MSSNGNFKKNTPYETDIQQLTRVVKELEEAFKKCADITEALGQGAFKEFFKITTAFMKLEKQRLHDTEKHNKLIQLQIQRSMDRIRIDENRAKLEKELQAIKQTEKQAARDFKNLQEQIHDQHVRQHIMLRNRIKESSDKLNFFTGALTKGIGIGALLGEMKNGLVGMHKAKQELGEFHNTLKLLNDKKAQLQGQGANTSDVDNEIINVQEKIKDLEDTIKNSMAAKVLGKKGESALEQMGAFASKHAQGLVLGAAAGGLLLMVIKKALDVSPAFQQVKKLLDYGFNLILRPIGDFFGFLLRPIVVMLMRMFIIPFYRTMYPFFRDWGTKIGQGIASLVAENGWLAIIAGGVLAIVSTLIGWKFFKTAKSMMKFLTGGADAAKGAKNAAETIDTATDATKLTESSKNLEKVRKAISTFYDDIKAFMNVSLEAYKIEGIGGTIKLAFTGMLEAININSVKVFGVFNDVKTGLGKVYELFKIDNIVKWFNTSFTKVLTQVTTHVAKITGVFTSIGAELSRVYDLFKFGNVIKWFSSGWLKLVTAVSEGITKLLGTVNDAIKVVKGVDTATDLTKGTIQGARIGKTLASTGAKIGKTGSVIGSSSALGKASNVFKKIGAMETAFYKTLEKGLSKIIGTTAAKTAVKAIPIVGWAWTGIDAAGSLTKQFAPEQYDAIRGGALDIFKKFGVSGEHAESALDLLGWGEMSTFEQLKEMGSMLTGGADVSQHYAGGMIHEPIMGIGRSGQMYSFGEKGAEYITPVGQGGTGSGTNVVINIGRMSGDQRDLAELRRTILNVLQEVNMKRGRV